MSDSLGPSFIQDVVEAFRPLVAQGRLAVVSSLYDPVTFGNALVEFKSKNAKIRVTRDRAEHFIQVAVPNNRGESWDSLESVLRATGASDVPSIGLQVTPAAAARIVEERLSALDEGFASAARVAKIKANLAKQSEEAWRRFRDRTKKG